MSDAPEGSLRRRRLRHAPRARHGLAALVVLVAMVATSVATSGPATASPEPQGPPGHHRSLRPVVFVHGGAGSGAQFQSQALRLTSNGYPEERVAVHEYDSTFATNTMAEVHAGLDGLIDRLLEESGADQVDLLGHSLGTAVSQGYLGDPDRAARVAHYVNIDGAPAAAPPGGVETLAVWGEGNPAREIVGADNLRLADQGHVQVATSAETFAAFYELFTGRRPWTTDILPQPFGRLRVSGEANLFPSNVGAAGATLTIWELDRETGHRRHHRPAATFEIGEDGAWGPFRARPGRHYEFAIDRDDSESTHHFYLPPFMRSDHLVRLLTSEPGSAIDGLRERSERHSSLNVVRYKEWWADQPAGNDALRIGGQDVLVPAIAPRVERVNALFAFDAGSDGATDLREPLPAFAALPFMTGADVFVPATTPPDGTVAVEMIARDGDGGAEVINVPNWASSDHHMTVQFRDFEQDATRFPHHPWDR